MRKSFFNRRLTFRSAIAALGLFALFMAVSQQFRSQAVGGSNQKSISGDGITRSHNPALENYDIRLDKSVEASESRAAFRQGAAKDELELGIAQAQVESAISDLRGRVPDLVIEYSPDLNAPEVIGIDVLKRTFLTGPSGIKHDPMVRGFIQQNKSLYGLTAEQINGLRTVADYTNPDGNLSFVDLQQRINGIEVFRGEVRAMITKQGEIARMINNLAPGLDYGRISKDFGRPEDAVFAAARHLNYIATLDDVRQIETKFDGNMFEFDRGQFADPTTAERMYFPIESGIAVPAWRVLIWEPVAAYYVVVDTEGRMLWRKNITDDQTQAATYNVYDSDGPAPLSPSTALPGTSFQAPGVARVNFTLIGNEAPNPGMNNLGWITDGTNGVNGHTDGNNAEAGLDVVAPDGVDAPVAGTLRVFSFAYTPGVGLSPAPGDAPTVPAYQMGMVTNMFYWGNRYHDVLYSAGFTEAARNFQNDNFGRGGVAVDRLRLEGQDSSGTNNANMSTPADGGRGRAQMFRFTGPTPNRDSGIDQDVFIHELTHGTSNRLIGNSTGLGNNRGGSMGEGWGDFYGRVLLSTASEDVNGIYTTGGWVTLTFAGTAAFTDNYYYGIRRFPYAVKTNVGGPLMRPHNPQTFADIDTAQLNNADGAFARSVLIGNTATEVHNAGEIWCMNLLEVRARIITRLGFAAGNTRTLQLVTDGMKVTPVSPTFTQARDAILSAATALGGTDTGDIWAGFATRGQGFGSSDTNASAVVVESFALPNIIMGTVTFSDAVTGNNNGVPDPGEIIVLTVPLQNPLSDPITGVTATISGNTQNYGTINGSTTVNRNFNYLVPAVTPCGSSLTVPVDINGSAGAVATNFTLAIGTPVIGVNQNFDLLVVPALPVGWTTAVTGSGVAWVTSTTTPDTAPNAIFTNDPATTSGSDVTTADIPVMAASATLQFRLNYNTELGWDGMVLEISIPTVAGGAFQDILTAGGSFTQNGYPRALNSSANPLSLRNAWTGNSAGYVTVKANLPATANGQNIKLKFRAGSDASVAGTGLRVDGIQVVNGFTCAPAPSRKPVADFDGDGKTDLSVFRSGTWYIQRSTAGALTQSWGLTTDKLTPGDFDGDGKADIAVFRENADPSMNFWYVLKSSTSTLQIQEWGLQGDVPKLGDYDGDGKTDFAIFRPSTSVWWILRSSDSLPTAQAWGASGDISVVGDFDGDNKADVTVFRPSNATWFVRRSTNGTLLAQQYGASTDKPVPSDYNGDGTTDFAVYRPSTNTWFTTLDLGTNYGAVVWGTAGDVLVPGDYDGDGKSDLAVFRPSNSTWYIRNTGGVASATPFGTSGDVAVPSVFVP